MKENGFGPSNFTLSEFLKIREFEEMLVEYNILRNVVTMVHPERSFYGLHSGEGKYLTSIFISDILSLPLSDLEGIVVSALFG